MVCGVVGLGIIGGVLAFFYKNRKSAEDKKHAIDLMERSHQHEQDMAQHEVTRSQLNLLAIHGREMLAIMPAGSARPALGLGPSTTEVPGPGRVFGAI